MLAALTGLLLGAWHVVSGPDHLAAVAPLATGGESRGARVGLAWGLGHAGGVWLVGLVLLVLGGSVLPLDELGRWSERVVGVAIVAVGLWGLWRVRHGRSHDHDHDHDHDHPHDHLHGRGRSALTIGLIHGLAGSSHLYGVLPALALAASERVAYLAGFGLGSIGAMVLFAASLTTLVRRLPGSRALVQRWATVLASVTAVIVGLVWVALSI